MQSTELARFLKPEQPTEKKRSRASKIPRIGKKYEQLVEEFCELDSEAQSEETFLRMGALLKLDQEKLKKQFRLALTLFNKRKLEGEGS